MEWDDNENTDQPQPNDFSSDDENEGNNQDESFVDRMQNEKRKHAQSIEILHRRRPTREQLMEAGIIKPTDKFTHTELGVVIEDILDDIKEHDINKESKAVKDKHKKKKKKKKKHTKDASFAPKIMNDDSGQAWDGEAKGWDQFVDEKTKKKSKKSLKSLDDGEKQEIVVIKQSNDNQIVETVMENNDDDAAVKEVDSLSFQLTANNLQQHNKLYSINGEFVINKFLDLKDEKSNDKTNVKSDKVNKIMNKSMNKSMNKQQSKNKVVKNIKNTKVESKNNVNKLTKTKAPKLTRKKSKKKEPKDSNVIVNNKVNKDLKQWMVKNSVWDNALYSHLILAGVLSYENVSMLNQKKFDVILRQFRVEKFSKVRDKKSRNHIDKILIKFEKAWRKTKKKKRKRKKK